MVEGILLIQGSDANRENLGSVSLGNAKQLVYGRFGEDGLILHVAATDHSYMQRAILDFSALPGVTSVSALALWRK